MWNERRGKHPNRHVTMEKVPNNLLRIYNGWDRKHASGTPPARSPGIREMLESI